MKFIFVSAVLIIACCGPCICKDARDTTGSIQKRNMRPSNLRLVTRLHSMGQFTYGGRIVSQNPTLDFNLTYDRKTWGLQIFKAQDLVDHNTDINFALAVVNKNFQIGNRLRITPSAGFILEEANTVADHGSDVVLILTSAYKLSPSLSLEHSSLIGNLVLEKDLMDWVNRFRLLYSKKHIDLGLMAWHNNKVFDTAEYMTLGASVFYSRIKISPVLSMNAGVTGLFMPYSNDEAEYPKKNGVVFTIGMILD